MPSNVDHARVAPGATGVNPDHPAAAHLKIVNADAGEVDVFGSGRKKIAICGFASSSRHLIPYDDKDWVIGAMNQFYRHAPRADYWFDIHSNWRESNVPGTDHPRALREIGFPVFMIERADDVPNSVRYPIERLIEKFGVDYFTSTVSYMIAWAIDVIDQAVAKRMSSVRWTASAPTLADAQAFTRSLYAEYTIGIFGIDLIVGDEYDFQKACAEFWLGVANARGIDIQIPSHSALLKQRWRYGYETQPSNLLIELKDYTARQAELSARISKVREAHERAVAELQTLDGALQEVNHHLAVIDLRLKGGKVPLAQS